MLARSPAASARSAAFFGAASARAIAADASRARAPSVCMYSAMFSAFMAELSLRVAVRSGAARRRDRGGRHALLAQRERQPMQRLPRIGRPVGRLQTFHDAVH